MEILQRTETPGVNDSPQLVERMDSAIGEASTSIGMIMSELVRRSLRGGVGEIGTSIHDYARDSVSLAVSDAMPQIEQTVEKIAESTSVRITDVAVNRIGEELKIVETRTAEKTEVFAARIKADAAAEFETVHRVIGESRECTEKNAQDLRDLQLRAKDSWKKVQLELQNVNEARARLERQLQDTEDRLTTSQQQLSQTNDRLDQTKQEHLQTREQLERTREQLETTALQLAETRRVLSRSQQELGQTQQSLAEARLILNDTQSNLSQLERATSQKNQTLESLCSSLAKRLEDLERPKGIRALFSRFKGNSGKQPETAPERHAEDED